MSTATTTTTTDTTVTSSSSKMKALSTTADNTKTTPPESTTIEENGASSPSSSSLVVGDNNASSSSSLPLVSWKHGLGRKASAAKSSSWMALALTLDGRDKITKLLQYLSRFLAWYWLGRGRMDRAARFGGLKVSLTNSRKAYRLGRTLMEFQKLSTMNLLSTIVGRYFQQDESSNASTDGTQKQSSSFLNRSAFIRRISSNLGPDPSSSQSSSTVPSAIPPAAAAAAAASKVVPSSSISTVSLIGSAIKLLGLAGFWAGDNINFLTSSGLFDNYQMSDQQERLKQRKQLQTKASLFANRSYFIGALAGLVVNWRAYRRFRRETHARLEQRLAAVKDNNNGDDDENPNDGDDDTLDKVRREAQEKQFVLFVALLKSCCDVLVFSNNPGIDLWKKHRGYKLNEGVHCVAGLLSASTVLYNNFPNKKK